MLMVLRMVRRFTGLLIAKRDASFFNPALKPRSTRNTFWKLAAIIWNRRPSFGKQNAIKIRRKRRKVEARFISSKIVFQSFGLESQQQTCLEEVSSCAQGGL
jgi:hypothetical protein